MEPSSYRRPFFSEQILHWLSKAFLNNRVPFLSGIIVGLLAHGYAFANKLVGYDEVGSLFNKGATASSGRWGLDLVRILFPDYSMPWVYGIIAIVLLSIAACFIVRIFAIRSPGLQALLSGSILAFPSLTATVVYMYTLSSYALSFLLAVIAVWMLQKKCWKWALGALVCMVISLGIYQSYIAIAASLLVLIMIQDLLQEGHFEDVLKKGIYFLAFLIVSLAAYLLVMNVVNRIIGIELNSYANARIQFRLSYLPTGVYEAYRAFYLFFSDGLWGLLPINWSRLVHCLCVLAVAALLLIWLLQKKRPWLELALLGVLIVLLPLAINCMYLFVTADPALTAIHTLVLYGFVAVYVFAAVVAEACDLPEFFAGKAAFLNRAAQNVILLGMAIAIVINIYMANGVYLNLYLRYENAYSFYSTLFAQLQQNPQFDEDMPVAIIGYYEDPNFYWDEFEFTYRIMGSDGFHIHSYTRWHFMYYYIGHQLNFASEEVSDAIAASEEFESMSIWPYYGSIQMLDGVLVVKLS